MSTSAMRKAWAPACRGPWGTVVLYGGLKVQVDSRTVEAFSALSACLAAHGYAADPNDPGGPGGLNCRAITGGTEPSLHAYGIAVDINPSRNPYANKLETDMPLGMIADIVNIRTRGGHRVFRWGGDWDNNPATAHSRYDPMHFEIVCTPEQLAGGLDPMTVQGATPVDPRVTVSASVRVVRLGSKGNAVRTVQHVVGAKPDGGFGPDTDTAVKAWQRTNGLTVDGIVGRSSWPKILGEM